MRAGTEWTLAEREIMATFVSERSSCRSCTSVHRAVAEAVCDVEIVDAVLAISITSGAPLGLSKNKLDPQRRQKERTVPLSAW